MRARACAHACSHVLVLGPLHAAAQVLMCLPVQPAASFGCSAAYWPQGQEGARRSMHTGPKPTNDMPPDEACGAVQRELELAKAQYMTEYETLYQERDQVPLSH